MSYSKEIKEEAVRLYMDEGLSCDEITKRLDGGSRASIVRWVREIRGIGVRDNRNRKRLPVSDEQLKKEYMEDFDAISIIAARYDVSFMAVRNRLVDIGVEINGVGANRHRVAGQISQRDREIYRLVKQEDRTQISLAAEYGISRQRVCQIMSRCETMLGDLSILDRKEDVCVDNEG